MPVARFQLPDGRVARFEVPEGTSPEQAQSLIEAQLPSLTQPKLSTALQPSVANEIPGPRVEPTMTQRVYQAVRPYAAPVVEAGGAILGGIAGAPLGPAGAVGGAGLGYGIGKEALKLADVYLGGETPRAGAAQIVEPLRNIAEGATMEVGGRVAGQMLGKAAGAIADLRRIPANKAAEIARNALGPDLPEVLNALRAAQGQGVSAAQATADINSPTWQALIARATERDPRFLQALKAAQGEVSLNALSRLAGGGTAAETRAANELAKQTLTDITSPARQAAITRANQGQRVAAFEEQAAREAEAAAGKVEDVRRLTAAGEKAAAAAGKVTPVAGMPRVPGRYTYPGELAIKADEWASKAAEASLDLGQGARFAQSAADSLRQAGVKPLETRPLIDSLRTINRNPEFAGNDVMRASVDNLTRDLAEWTGKGGVIDAQALDAIRKNSVNAAVRDLLKGQDPSIQREAAASVMSRIKPMIVDAMEAAGGKGYRAYLDEYSKGMQDIAKQKLTGEALNLWKTDKDAFVRLVQNEAPEVVEKFLGRGNYNIATELADDTMQVLRDQAQKHLTELKIKAQVSGKEGVPGGQEALKQLLLQHTSKLRLPSYLSAMAATTNKALNILENKIGQKTMRILTESLKTPEGAANLLESLPAAERSKVLKLISSPDQWSAGTKALVRGGTAAGINALAPDRYSENALATQPVRIVETAE